MNFNQDYSNVYDLIYREKSYKSEFEYFYSLQDINSSEPVLELGCGTGSYTEFFTKKGHEVLGVDLSSSMLEICQRKFKHNFTPLKSSIEEFTVNSKFKYSFALFHVFSYLTSNEKVRSSLHNINKHLQSEGLFIFDFWFTPGVLNIGPETRIKHFENNEMKVLRISEPSSDHIKNLVNVNFTTIVTDKLSQDSSIHYENHLMRHFSIPELQYLAQDTGFEILEIFESFTVNKPDANTWAATAVFCKK